MGLAHSPSIVTNGLVLCLDAANQKSLLSSVEYLIVAGGGGGSNGGAGAGGLLTGTTTVTVQSYTITVGAGGAGAPSFQPTRPAASDGANSVAFGLTAIGGGAGGPVGKVGRNGGSGGGGGADSGNLRVGGTGVAGQGNAGGLNSTNRGAPYPTGGGGGAGAAGADGTGTSTPGSGGIGILSNISGLATFYAGGGGGSLYSGSVGAVGGLGGGGNGGTSGLGQPGSPNTGGGAGGTRGDISGGPGPIGGSGIVVIRYPGSQRATGGTITSVNGDTVHTFTTSGTFTLNIISDLRGGNNGTLVNGPTFNSANQGSLVFDGIDDVIHLTHASTPITNLTYEIIAKIDSIPPSNTLRSIWQKSANWNGSTGISLQMIYGSLRFSYGETWSGSASYLLTNLTEGNWYHIVGTSTATSNGTTRLYINSLLVGSGTGGTPTTTSILQVGQGNGGSLLGNISMFRSYNRALTAQEIQQNFNALRGRYGI